MWGVEHDEKLKKTPKVNLAIAIQTTKTQHNKVKTTKLGSDRESADDQKKKKEEKKSKPKNWERQA